MSKIYGARYKTRLCTYFTANKDCPDGNECTFAHGQQELNGDQGLKRPIDASKRKTRMCDLWLAGVCGHSTEKCPFAHGTDDLRGLNPTSFCHVRKIDDGPVSSHSVNQVIASMTSNLPFNGSYKTKLCNSWLDGKCFKPAIQCKFAHGSEDLRKNDVPSFAYKSKLCEAWLNGECAKAVLDCGFAHGHKDLVGQQKARDATVGEFPYISGYFAGDDAGFTTTSSEMINGGGDGVCKRRIESKSRGERKTKSPVHPTVGPVMTASVEFPPFVSGPSAPVACSYFSPSMSQPSSINKVGVLPSNYRELSPRTQFLLESKAKISPDPKSKGRSDRGRSHRSRSRSPMNSSIRSKYSMGKRRVVSRKSLTPDSAGNSSIVGRGCRSSSSFSLSPSPPPSSNKRKPDMKNLKDRQQRFYSPSEKRRWKHHRSRSPETLKRRSTEKSIRHKSPVDREDRRKVDASPSAANSSELSIEPAVRLVTLEDVDRIELEKAHSIVDFTKSLLDKESKKNPSLNPREHAMYAAYAEAKDNLEALKTKLRAKQRKAQCNIEKFVKGTTANIESEMHADKQKRHGSVISKDPSLIIVEEDPPIYLEVSTLDKSVLTPDQVLAYFINFGAIDWCLQAGSVSTVIFGFKDTSLIKTALEFIHRIERKPIRLQGMKDGGIPVGAPSITEISYDDDLSGVKAPRPLRTSKVITPSGMPKTPEAFAQYIDKLAASY